MKNIFKIKIILISLFFASCTTWKDNLKEEGNLNDTAVRNAIYDFSNSSSVVKKYDVFALRVIDINRDIIAVSIIQDSNKLYPTPKIKIGSNEPYFPTKYFELNNKLFFWYDSTHNVTKEIVSVLSKYNHIDSVNVNGIVEIPETVTDESIKAMHYFFCKNNLLEYKKTKSNIGLGYYTPPNVDCN